MSNLKLPPYQKTQRRSYAGFTAQNKATSPASNFATSFQLLVTAPSSPITTISENKMTSNDKFPIGYLPLENQVAGHTFQIGTDQMGMLKCGDDGSVLKPGGSPMCASREIKFYEQILTSSEPEVLQLKEFIPGYRGTQTLSVGNKTIKFIKLQDVTHGMLEPCVIDLKMGKRTWDPLASAEKKEAEDGKYVKCKSTVGFCIPGFQTYDISSESYKKFGKEYGKKLNEDTIKDALRLFLNSDSGLSRQLITQILTNLWAIQKWMQSQKTFQFYSSSILIAYDARRLRQILETQKRKSSPPNLLDINIASNGKISPIASGKISPIASGKSTPIESNSPRIDRKNNSAADAFNGDAARSPPISVYKKIQRSHSSTNDYEKEMRNMRLTYQQMLDNLVGTYDEKKEWVQVKMIDFAHTFTSCELADGQQAGLDTNYLCGIESLVKIFEDFLKVCEL